MAMRAQLVDYCTSTTTDGIIEVFGTKFGRIMFTKATEFIVIEDVGCSPYVTYTVAGNTIVADITTQIQVKINTTEYFLNPDGSRSFGVPGRASPYPRSNLTYPSFKLEPDIYVLPGQNWELLFYKDTSIVSGLAAVPAPFPVVCCFAKYTLYDGTDAVIANKLLEMGITVKPQNIDWYKRQLIEKGEGGEY